MVETSRATLQVASSGASSHCGMEHGLTIQIFTLLFGQVLQST